MFTILAAMLLAQSAPAIAVTPPSMHRNLDREKISLANAELDLSMREYFAGEKRQAWAWVGMGLAAAGTSGALSASSSNVSQGASYPLLDIAVVQLGAAAWLLFRTDDQVERLSTQLARAPCEFFAEEPGRMRRVRRGRSIYLPIEATTLVGGAAMAGLGAAGHHDLLAGAGWGLVAQSVVMLVFDQFALARAIEYDDKLQAAAHQNARVCQR